MISDALKRQGYAIVNDLEDARISVDEYDFICHNNSLSNECTYSDTHLKITLLNDNQKMDLIGVDSEGVLDDLIGVSIFNTQKKSMKKAVKLLGKCY